MAITDFYTSTAKIEKKTDSINAMGGVTKVFDTRIASLPCRLNPKSVTETDEFGRTSVRQVQRLYCSASSANLAISESDRVVIDDRTFEVTGIANPAWKNHHLEIELSELR